MEYNTDLIESNTGTLKHNYQTVAENSGKVEMNFAIVEKNFGTVERNMREVRENFGTVNFNVGLVHNYRGKVLDGLGEVIEYNEVKVSDLSGIAATKGLTELDEDGDGDIDSLWFSGASAPQDADIYLHPGYTMEMTDGDCTLTRLGTDGAYMLSQAGSDVALTITSSAAPMTGDHEPVALWGTLMILAGAGAVTAMRRRRFENRG